MSHPTHVDRWCHACCCIQEFNAGWYEVWIGTQGEFVSQPVSDPYDYHKHFRGDTFACGQGSALVLFERYLHTRTFDPPSALANPVSTLHATVQPDAFESLT